MELGMLMEVRPVQARKQSFPKVVTELGMLMEVILEQLEKASS